MTHKETDIPSIDNYIPLLVGGVNHPDLFGLYESDDSGDNISYKNDSYCELTGLYWMWKNTSHRFLGLVHYRRFFAEVHRLLKIKDVYYSVGAPSYRIYEENELISKLESKELLVIESPKLPWGNRKILESVTGSEIWTDLDTLIKTNYPEYFEYYIVSCQNHNHIQCNMFFGNRTLVEEYCKWIFTLLDSLDKMHVENTGDRYHNRELGYIAELLFDVWIKRNRVTYEVVDCIVTSNSNNDQHQIKRIWKLPKDLLRNAYQWIER